MNTLTFQKKVAQLERFIKKAGRVLLEFEVAQAEWETARGMFKIYKSTDSYFSHVDRKLKSK